MQQQKNKAQDTFNSMMDNKYVRVGFIVILSVGGLYVLSQVFKVIGNTVTSFKEMTDSFKN